MDGENISIKVEVWGSTDIVTAAQGDNAGLVVEDHDIARPVPCYTPSDDVEEFCKAVFQAPDLRKRDSVVRSRMAPARPETEPEETTCEEFFDCEKRSSHRGTVKLFKRFIPETNEIAIEAFDYRGACTSTRFVSVEEIDEGSPLAKSEIMSQMNKTLNQVRASLTAPAVALAEKAIRSLDVPAFLEIIRTAKSSA
jgi:hypothetical protein